MEMQGAVECESVAPNQTSSAVIGIDFADTTQAVNFELIADERKHQVSIAAPVGEQLQPIMISMDQFKVLQRKLHFFALSQFPNFLFYFLLEKLSGMNETSGKIKLAGEIKFTDQKTLGQKICEVANVIQVPSSEEKVRII